MPMLLDQPYGIEFSVYSVHGSTLSFHILRKVNLTSRDSNHKTKYKNSVKVTKRSGMPRTDVPVISVGAAG